MKIGSTRRDSAKRGNRALWGRSLRLETLEPRLALAGISLVITEIMYHPAPVSAPEDAAGFNEDDFEFLELQNVGADTISLEGVALTRGVDFRFGAHSLAPNQYIVVAKNIAAFQMRYGVGAQLAGEFGGTLSNSGEQIRLRDPADAILLDFTYLDSWYPSTDGEGYSLVIVDSHGLPAAWSLAESWRASHRVGGSPGTPDGEVDPTLPSTPQGLSGVLVSPTRIDLQWQPARDDESGIREYRVFRNDALLAAVADASFSDTTVLPNSSYRYEVMAVNGFGLESDRSNAATFVIDPVGQDPAFAAGQAMGMVSADQIGEASGLVASRRSRDVLWTHNDGAGEQSIYAFNAQGGYLGAVTLAGMASVDWEDMAIGPGPTPGTDYLYVGDIGDNAAQRDSIRVYRVLEPVMDPSGGDQSKTIPAGQYDMFTLRYPDGAHDAEALLVDPLTGDLYVIAKEAGPSRVYRAATQDLADDGQATLTLVGQISFSVPSAGDISPNGREILVRNENMAQLFVRGPGQSVADALAGVPFDVPVIGQPVEPNGEAISFDATGSGYFTISEGVSPTLYYFHRISRSPGTPAVLDRHVFYNNSVFDGHDAAANEDDDEAIARDKVALRPGSTASFDNYTSYSRGINGIMIDIIDLPAQAVLDATDFQFHVGNSDQPGTWAVAPQPREINVRRGAGTAGSDRITVTWDDGAIVGKWIEVQVLATADTGLARADVFYFGNAVGESGNSVTDARVDAADLLQTRNHRLGLGEWAGPDHPFDFNRDGRVDAVDMLLTRSHITQFFSALRLIRPAVPVVAQTLAAPATVLPSPAVSDSATVSSPSPVRAPADAARAAAIEAIVGEISPAERTLAVGGARSNTVASRAVNGRMLGDKAR